MDCARPINLSGLIGSDFHFNHIRQQKLLIDWVPLHFLQSLVILKYETAVALTVLESPMWLGGFAVREYPVIGVAFNRFSTAWHLPILVTVSKVFVQ